MRKVLYEPPLPAYCQGNLYQEVWKPTPSQKNFLRAWINKVIPDATQPDQERPRDQSLESSVEKEDGEGPNSLTLSEHELEHVYDRMELEATRFFSQISNIRKIRAEERKTKRGGKKRYRDYRGQRDSYARNKFRRY